MDWRRAALGRCEVVRHHHARPVVETRRVDALYWRCTSVPPSRPVRPVHSAWLSASPRRKAKEKTIARGDGPRGATQFRAPPTPLDRARRCALVRGTAAASMCGAMPWAWIKAPTPSVPTDPLDGSDEGVRAETHGPIRPLLTGAGLPPCPGSLSPAKRPTPPDLRLCVSTPAVGSRLRAGCEGVNARRTTCGVVRYGGSHVVPCGSRTSSAVTSLPATTTCNR